ncbi:MAG: hypothetical protein ACOH2E_08695 [Candidatus Paracaedibacter sp.]
MKHFILSLIISSTLSLSTLSMEAPQELTPLESLIAKVWTYSKMPDKWENISANGMTYRKREVPGDNDCGIHSLNVLFPESNLSRSTILDRFTEILKNPQHEHHVFLKDELANDLYYILYDEIFITWGSVKSSYPQILEQFPEFVAELRMNDLIESDSRLTSDHYIQLAKDNMTTLEIYINYFRNENARFISMPDRCIYNNDFLLLVCKIYNFNIKLIRYSDNGNGDYGIRGIGRYPEHQKGLLFYRNHFSPLCPINDVDARNRLATWYANEVIFKGLGVFKKVNVPSTNLEELRRMVGQTKMADRNILTNKKTQPFVEGSYPSNTHSVARINTVNNSFIKGIDEQQEDNKLAEDNLIANDLILYVKEKKCQDNALITILSNNYGGDGFDDTRYKRIVELARAKADTLDKEKEKSMTQEKNHNASPIIVTPTNINLEELFPLYIVDNLIYFAQKGWKDNAIIIDLKNKGYHFDDSKYEQIIASVRSRV